MKGEGADCSGATWKIYEEAGFSYGSYQSTATFRTLVGADNDKEMKGKHFKQVTTPQVGDIGWWNGHMAIFDLNAGKTGKEKDVDGVLSRNPWNLSDHSQGGSYEKSTPARMASKSIMCCMSRNA